MALTDILNSVAPSVIEYGLAQLSNKDNNQIVDNYTGQTVEAAKVLNTGYDEQLAALMQGYDYLRGISANQLEDVTNLGTKAVGDYAGISSDSINAYGNAVAPLFNEFGQQITDNTADYIDTISGVGQQAAGQLTDGFAGAEGLMSPYVQSGEEANSYLSQILATDPAQLTSSQRIAYEAAKRDALATLAASSLRGSGRAGVYSVAKAMGDTQATMEDNNRRRADAAATALNSGGQSASSNLAGQRMNLGTNLSNLTSNVGNKVAEAQQTTSNDLASKAYGLGADIAQKNYALGTDVAGKTYTQGQQTAQNTADYYGNVANVESQRASAVGNTALRKADNTAKAISSNATATSKGNASRSENTNDVLGNIASVFAPMIKKDAASGANSNTANGKVK